MCTCMLANITYAIAGNHMLINQAYQPPMNKHVSQIAHNRYQTTLQADQLCNYDKLHAAQHATGAKVFMDLQDDGNGNLDRQERCMRPHLNLGPAESDDESEDVDDIIDQRVPKNR